MTLATVESVARRSGVAVRIVDELLGAGNGSNLSFDLANDHVVEGTYTINYAPTTGNSTNSFTALTETTHYTLDRESGRVLLTGTGASVVSTTNSLYATYTYLGKGSEADVDSYITRAGARAYGLTGRYWTDTSITEYHDGVGRSYYPRTNRPFQADKPTWDSITLEAKPVKSISSVYFLNRHITDFGEVHSDDGGSFTDNTAEASTVEGTVFNVFASTPAVNDAIYFGLAYKFLGLVTNLETLGTDAGSLAVTWEYYDGSTWTSFTPTAQTTNADTFLASGKLTWSMPSGWSKTTVNGGQSLYFVRARLSAGSYTAVPTMWEAYPDPDSVLYKHLSVRDVNIDGNRLAFLNENVPHGVANIRVDFVAGISSSDPLYSLGLDLVDAIASLNLAVAITGGSFDDETSFTLGGKSVTIGEVYVNVAEVVKQLTNEIEELKKAIGTRVVVARNRNLKRG